MTERAPGRLEALPRLSRRAFLRRGVQGAGALSLAALGSSVVVPSARAASGADGFGPLQDPDENGLRLPAAFTSRIVAVSGQVVPGTSHVWHAAPDGGATFETDDGWIYVSNSEAGNAGGVGALRFAADGTLVDAYPILTNTRRNCAGGPTPWGTWLSCEEVSSGFVYECDPYTPGSSGIPRPALGSFNHEAAAVDPATFQIYLTEDRRNGLLYRFTPDAPLNRLDLDSGVLEVAEVLDPGGAGRIRPGDVRPLTWHPLLNPTPFFGGVQNPLHQPPEARATRFQVEAATPFDGGEGCWYRAGLVYFATKGDSRVWLLDTRADTLEIVYDFATTSTPELFNVDNVFVSPAGDVYVAEDPGDLQIVALTPSGGVVPIVQITGQVFTEVTGPALDPSGTRLYFSSQRFPGITYEVTGPFAVPVEVPLLDGPWRALFAAALGAGAALSLRKSAGDDA